ncbi:hypothetical protein AB833_28060 [Chromatiales bacterium (ex Bugula neritina AB1)]|nr:hypothetical protein AB833_28060 [Chromatiales bacterium (ex Bugula neritina AB1)]
MNTLCQLASAPARFIRGFISILMAVAVSACATVEVPQVQFYTLQSQASGEEPPQGSVEVANAGLRIERVSMAAYLSQPGIVITDSDGKIYSANYHQWAELPKIAIKRRLERCVLTNAGQGDGRQLIRLNVDKFQGDEKGNAVFGGVWTMIPQGARSASETYLFEYREKQIGDGYVPLVAALSVTVQKLCEEIRSFSG